MSRRVFTYAVAAAVASFCATIAATVLYVVVALHERPDISTSFLVGLHPALEGIVLAVPAAVMFSFFQRRLNRVVFVIGAAATASVLGALLGFWVAGNSPHVSAKIAAVFLALTWSTAAVLVALFAARSPN